MKRRKLASVAVPVVMALLVVECKPDAPWYDRDNFPGGATDASGVPYSGVYVGHQNPPYFTLDEISITEKADLTSYLNVTDSSGRHLVTYDDATKTYTFSRFTTPRIWVNGNYGTPDLTDLNVVFTDCTIARPGTPQPAYQDSLFGNNYQSRPNHLASVTLRNCDLYATNYASRNGFGACVYFDTSVTSLEVDSNHIRNCHIGIEAGNTTITSGPHPTTVIRRNQIDQFYQELHSPGGSNNHSDCVLLAASNSYVRLVHNYCGATGLDEDGNTSYAAQCFAIAQDDRPGPYGNIDVVGNYCDHFGTGINFGRAPVAGNGSLFVGPWTAQYNVFSHNRYGVRLSGATKDPDPANCANNVTETGVSVDGSPGNPGICRR
jgi:hypothetical protein